MSSVTETSTSALGKQGEMLFFLVFQGAKLAVCVFVRMCVAPALWIKAEIVRGESVYGELLLGQSRVRRNDAKAECSSMYATRPTSYVTHFKRALSFGEAQVTRTGDTKVEMRLATREDSVKNSRPVR